MQFGFHHDTENSEFVRIQSNVINIPPNFYNQVCPQYVRFVWDEVSGSYASLKKDDVLMTLVYYLVKEEEHFICMMESALDGSCDKFLREVIDEFDGDLIVDDVCANFTTKNGELILTDSKDVLEDETSIFYDPSTNSLRLDLRDGITSVDVSVFDLSGRLVLSQTVYRGRSQIRLDNLTEGAYAYLITRDQVILKSAKFLRE